MLWIKRNLMLVIGVVVALALLGGAVFYVIYNFDENAARDEDLEKLKVELDQLKSGTFPSLDNIAMVKSNVAQVTRFTAAAEDILAHEAPKATTASQFSIALPRVLDDLRRDATNASVDLPPRYEFTFGEVKAMTRLPSYALEPLAARLSEVRTICGVLFKARVRALESLNRVAAFADEPKGADLLTDRMEQTNSMSTNVSVVVTPYRVVFRGFSGDLSAVLNGFSATKDFFVVRQVSVEPAGGMVDTSGGGQMTPMMTQPNPFQPPTLPGGMQPPAAPMMNPGAPRPPAPKTGVAPAPLPLKSSLVKVLDEKPLRITLVLDVIKVTRKPVAGPVGAAPAASGSAPVPAAAVTPVAATPK